MMNTVKITTNSPAETIEWGRKIGKTLKGGEVIALQGDLGTGKTHLIKGIACGLEVAGAEVVTSPTFVLVNEYMGRSGLIHIYHIDAYRMESAAEFAALGFDDYCRPDSVVLVEWADKVIEVVAGFDPITIHMEHRGENQRKITIQNAPDYLWRGPVKSD